MTEDEKEIRKRITSRRSPSRGRSSPGRTASPGTERSGRSPGRGRQSSKDKDKDKNKNKSKKKKNKNKNKDKSKSRSSSKGRAKICPNIDKRGGCDTPNCQFAHSRG